MPAGHGSAEGNTAPRSRRSTGLPQWHLGLPSLRSWTATMLCVAPVTTRSNQMGSGPPTLRPELSLTISLVTTKKISKIICAQQVHPFPHAAKVISVNYTIPDIGRGQPRCSLARTSTPQARNFCGLRTCL